jgi:hypothetical protein
MTLLVLSAGAIAQTAPSGKTALPGTEEFGLSQKELVQSVEKVEALIAKCMREHGFEYVAADYATVRKAMTSDKKLPGIGEEEFVENYGFGISTFYSGKPPQLTEGYCPARVGLGDRNVEVFKKLSSADQAAYDRALLGENTDATFAVALEGENFSRCGGCTLKAIQQVFKSDQIKEAYYNPKDAMINKDPRMKAALKEYAEKMKEAGFDYSHPDEVEADILKRLNAITGGKTIPLEEMSVDQRLALKKLQTHERRAGIISFRLSEEIFDPVEEQIQKEMYARPVK